MTQQPYYPQQYPPPPPAYPQQPPQQYAPPPPAYPQQPQQGYGQPFPGVQAPPAQPAVPLAQGTLDDFYNQPTGGGGPSISWQNKPDGTTYVGIVARDVGNGDVQQQTDPMSKQPQFYKDGRPKFVMKVPLKVQPSQEHPEGEAALYVRGQMREELTRAMSEAGAGGSPKAGDAIQVTLTHRKPSRGGGNPMNVFAIRYTPAAGGAGAPSPAPEPQQQAQPVQQPVPPAPEFAQAQYQAYAAQPAYPVPAPAAQQFEQAPAQAPQQAQQPTPQQQGAPQPPAGLSPEQQQLLLRLTGGQG